MILAKTCVISNGLRQLFFVTLYQSLGRSEAHHCNIILTSVLPRRVRNSTFWNRNWPILHSRHYNPMTHICSWPASQFWIPNIGND